MILPFVVSLTEKGDSRYVINSFVRVKLCFLKRDLITASLKVLGTYLNDNDELIIFSSGSMTSGSTSFSSLDGVGSNIHVVGLDDLPSLYNSSSPIVENVWNCSSGDL